MILIVLCFFVGQIRVPRQQLGCMLKGLMKTCYHPTSCVSRTPVLASLPLLNNGALCFVVRWRITLSWLLQSPQPVLSPTNFTNTRMEAHKGWSWLPPVSYIMKPRVADICSKKPQPVWQLCLRKGRGRCISPTSATLKAAIPCGTK